MVVGPIGNALFRITDLFVAGRIKSRGNETSRDFVVLLVMQCKWYIQSFFRPDRTIINRDMAVLMF